MNQLYRPKITQLFKTFLNFWPLKKCHPNFTKIQFFDLWLTHNYVTQISDLGARFCATAGLTRKYAIRIMAIKHKQEKKISGRSRTYSRDVIFHLQKLWHIMNHMCSKKMVAAFPSWLEYYEAPNFTKQVKLELLTMSYSTIDRYLSSCRAKFARSNRSGTKGGGKSQIKHIIPLRPFNQEIDRPGFIETDTVLIVAVPFLGNLFGH